MMNVEYQCVKLNKFEKEVESATLFLCQYSVVYTILDCTTFKGCYRI